MISIAAPKKELRENSQRFRIGIFREEGFPVRGVPEGLTPDWLKEVLENENFVVFLDELEIRTYSLMRPEFLDLIILPYGEAFPQRAFRILKKYLQDGGCLLTTGGRPFWKPIRRESGQWKVEECDPYDRYLSELGIKYYQPENPPADFHFDTELLPDCPERMGAGGGSFGLITTTSDEYALPDPPCGNVFPERVPTRSFDVVVEGRDRYGQAVCSSVILARNWQSGGRWCLVGATGEEHPLSPNWPYAARFLRDVVAQLASPLMLYELHPGYACYRQGEGVDISVRAANFSPEDRRASLQLTISTEEGIVQQMEKKLKLGSGQKQSVEFHWQPEQFESDLYFIEARLYDGSLLVDRTKNGFVVWDREVLERGPSIKIQGNYFQIREKESVITGVNYYESERGELMWLKPNVWRLAQDLRQMRQLGINYLRPHYHHSKWFRDYMKYAHRGDLPEYFSVADTTPLPSERSLRIFDAIIQLCQKNGIIYGGDLFTLVPEEMGDPRGWVGVFERCSDPEKITLQMEFLKLLAQRYKGVPGISWDLWNEPENFPFAEYLYPWVAKMKDVLRESGDEHPITVGASLGVEESCAVDYVSYHGFEVSDELEKGPRQKPFILQEVWMDEDSSLKGDRRQRERLIRNFHKALKIGAAGFAPWSWTRQARLWNNNRRFPGERWDDELGCCVREDMSVKPAGYAYQDLIALISQVTLAEKITEGRFRTSTGELWIEPENIAGLSTGRWGLIHLKQEEILLIECTGFLTENGQKILSFEGIEEATIMAFSRDGQDIRDSSEIFLKADCPGKLRLLRRKGVKGAFVVQTNGREFWQVAKKQICWENNYLSFKIEPDELNYWVRLCS